MKSMKRLSFVTLVVVLTSTACTLQKRVFMPGYHVEWHSTKQSIGKESLPTETDVEKDAQSSTNEQGQRNSTDYSSMVDQTTTSDPLEQKITAEPQFSEKTLSTNDETKVITKPTSTRNAKKALNHLAKKTTKLDSDDTEDSGGGGGGLRVIGWILIIVGLAILIFSSILIGVLLMILGLIFVISGKKKKSPSPSSSSPSEKKKEKSEYIDVVYLKNGSIIRGTLIELIPNVSLKIETKDGSVFFYKMEEVEKITKELAK
jgi:hypothetical protein